jgi:hypothetical protein
MDFRDDGGLALAVIVFAVALIFAAFVWFLGVAGAQGSLCPKGSPERGLTGLDTQRSLWPPGATCTTREPDGHRQASVEPVFPGITAAILAPVVQPGRGCSSPSSSRSHG